MLVLMASAAPALAQEARVKVGIGGTFSGAASAGTSDVVLLDPSGGSLVLYRTTNRITSGRGVEGLVSMKLRDRFRVELGIGWVRSKFETRISGDFEDVPGLSLTQKVNQYTAEAALVWRVMQRNRFDVFVRGGAGGYREITTDRALVDNGWRATVGGGTQVRLSAAPSGWLGRLALRADVRLQVRGGGIAFGDSGPRLSPVLFAGLVIGQ